nr:RNA-binding protein MEX3B [Vicugna pacos]
MTECVPVPSSEHVAEIVGRQGCKIKALRAKTNTYIKTPVRGEEPVFVVTGRKEDVAMARREIISAAEHFSMIRASRNKNTALNGAVPGPPNLPGQTTIQVRVPYRVVGLVVGPKGATIKRIQQQTHTYIVTPSRDKEPVFEVTGMPENVDRAREEIEAHIALRTGGIIELTDENDFHANGTDVGFDLHHGSGGSGPGSLWSKPTPSITPTPGRKPFSSYRNDSSSSLGSASTDSYFGGGTSGSAAATPRLADYSPPSPALSFAHNGNNNNGNGYTYTAGEASVPSPDGCPELQPTFDPAPAPPPGAPLLWAQFERSPGGGPAAPVSSSCSSSASSSASSSSVVFPGGGASAPSNANLGLLVHRRLHPGTSCPRLSPPLHMGPGCSVCFESEVIAALVPCGHNLFCMECANRICEKSEPECPVCHTAVTQAIRIFS